MDAVMAARLLGLLSALLLALTMARLGHHLRIQRRFAFTRHMLAAEDRPQVSVLVPARNEELNLEACLRSLLEQDPPPLEVLVWDDASEDRTLALARRLAAADPGLGVYAGDGPPPGWIGKCHALHSLAARARGDWLLFVDADTVQAPGSLGAALAYLRHHRLEALSLSGDAVLGSFWEKVWEPLWPCFLFFWLPPDRVNDPDSPVCFAVGQWLLVSREAYRAVGGHEAVRGAIVEDCALLARLKQLRVPYRVVFSTPLFRVRMYRSLGEIWLGWSKNIHPALGLFAAPPLAAPLSALALAVITVAPFAVAFATLLGLLPGLGPLAAYGPAALALGTAWLVRLHRPSNPAYFWTLPLAGALAALVLLNSTWRALTGRPVSWKGRSYPGGRPGGDERRPSGAGGGGGA